MATRGRITSHLRTWYSTHSEIDGDIAFHEVKAGVTEHRADALGLQVHAVDMPIGVGKNVLAQVMADESIDPENQNVFQIEPLLIASA